MLNLDSPNPVGFNFSIPKLPFQYKAIIESQPNNCPSSLLIWWPPGLDTSQPYTTDTQPVGTQHDFSGKCKGNW